MPAKQRVDTLLVGQGLAESRSQAQRIVMAGQVRVDGELVHKPSQKIDPSASIVVAALPRFVSRGGDKLQGALDLFQPPLQDAICADVGASTGGFTDCLLQNGAAKVYSIDVGHGLIHWRLQNDPRVVILERTNARHLEGLPEPVQLVTIDVSFISLRIILDSVIRWLVPGGHVIALVKPQFEAGRELVGKGGVVRDPAVHQSVLTSVAEHSEQLGLGILGTCRSPLLGPKGNQEFFLWSQHGAKSVDWRPQVPSVVGPVTGTGEGDQ